MLCAVYSPRPSSHLTPPLTPPHPTPLFTSPHFTSRTHQDIDQILESRAHTIVTDPGSRGAGNAAGAGDGTGAGAGAGAGGSSAFVHKKKPHQARKARKSVFSGDAADDVDVNDPDFWAKVLPDLVTPDTMANRLSVLESEEDAENAENANDEGTNTSSSSSSKAGSKGPTSKTAKPTLSDPSGAGAGAGSGAGAGAGSAKQIERAITCTKFFTDLTGMVTGIFDLDRRGTLADRVSCMLCAVCCVLCAVLCVSV